MRKFSSNVLALMAAENTTLFYAVRIANTNVEFCDTTAPYSFSLTLPGVGAKVFSPSAGLMTVESPRLSDAVDRETYKLAYIDPEFEKISNFEEGLTGASFTVYAVFVNTTNSTLGGAAPGELLLNYADLVIAYGGVVDTVGYTIDPDSGTVVAAIEGSSPVASLGQIKGFYTSRDAMNQRNVADSSFNEIYVGSAKVALLWGKKSV